MCSRFGDFFPGLLHLRPAGAFLFFFRQVYDMLFTGDCGVYRLPARRASPLVGFYFLDRRICAARFAAFLRAFRFVKKKRLVFITKQLFRRPAKPFKEQ